MQYLVNPNQSTNAFIWVIEANANGNFPNQVNCSGYSLPKAGKFFTGATMTVSCIQGGFVNAEIWASASLVRRLFPFLFNS